MQWCAQRCGSKGRAGKNRGGRKHESFQMLHTLTLTLTVVRSSNIIKGKVKDKIKVQKRKDCLYITVNTADCSICSDQWLCFCRTHNRILQINNHRPPERTFCRGWLICKPQCDDIICCLLKAQTLPLPSAVPRSFKSIETQLFAHLQVCLHSFLWIQNYQVLTFSFF